MWINCNGFPENYPSHNEVCLTRSIISDTIKLAVFDDKVKGFYRIENGQIDKTVVLHNSCRYWKKIKLE